MRQTCEDLAKEELEHKAKLELEVMKRGEVVHGLDVSDYIVDIGSELDMDYEDMLVFAIKKEDTSVKLYTDLAAIVKNEQCREILLALAKEETEHKQQFEIEYEKLLKED